MEKKPTYEKLEPRVQELKRKEEETKKLHESEELYRTFFNQAAVGVAQVAPDGTFKKFNSKFYQIVGYQKDELSNLTFHDITHPEDLHLDDTFIAKVMADEIDSFEIEKRYIHKDGHIVWIALYSNVVRNEDRSVKYAVAVITDISDRVKAEEALKESEQELQRTLDATTDGIWTWNFKSNELTFSPRYYTMLGYEPDEFPANYENWMDLIHPDDRQKTLAVAEEYLKTKSDSYENEFRLRTSAGDYRWILASARVVKRDENCGPVYMIGNHQDITERRQAEESLRLSERRLLATIDATPFPVAIVDLDDDKIIHWSYSAFILFGHTAPTTSEWYQIAYPDPSYRMEVIKRWKASLEKARNTNRTVNTGEYRVTCKDGSEKVCELYAAFITGYLIVTFNDITKRKNALDSLENERSFLNAILDNIEEAIVICNAEGQLTRFNESARRLHGIPEKPITPDEWSNHYDLYRVDGKTSLPVHEIPLFRALRGEKVADAEIIVAPKNSKPRHMVCNGQALYDHRDTKIGAVIAMHDLTEQKRAEDALRESENKYRIIAENMADIITVMDMDLNFTYVSPSIVKLRGFTVEESMEQKIDEIMTAESFKRLSDAFDEELHLEQTGTADPDRVRIMELEEYKKDGSTIWIENTASFIRNNDQKPVGILVVSRDITERKQAEKHLEAVERRNQALLDHSPVCHKIVELDFNLQYMSDSGFQMLKIDNNTDVYGKPYPFYFFPEAFQKAMIKNLEKVKETGEAHTLEALTNDIEGNQVWLHSSLIPVFDHDGNIEYITVVSADVTQRKHDEKEKDRLEGQLRQAQKMEAVGRLAGGVAHDFNNMLSVILGHAEMALEQLDPSQPLYRDLEEVRNAGQRSADLTRQLLAFARKQTVSPKVLDLNKTVSGMAQMLRRLMGEDIDLRWNPGKKIWRVKIDPSQVDQILANLCVNARDAIKGVGRVSVETGTAVFDEAYCADHPGFLPGEYTLLAVSDDGCGMTPEIMENIFDPFYSSKEADKGTGLGLSTVYGVVKQNNGFINVYSEPEQGTTFRIYLPRHHAKKSRLSGDDAEQPIERGHETILLVEDEPSILRMTAMMLEKLGYRVLKARTPGEAIEMAQECTDVIHLLLTDVVMPEMNGRELVKNVLSSHPNLKRLFMSGYTANVIAHHGVLDEGVNFIQKPFSREQLGAKVREALSQGNG